MLYMAHSDDPFFTVPLAHLPDSPSGKDALDYIEKHILGKAPEELKKHKEVWDYFRGTGGRG